MSSSCSCRILCTDIDGSPCVVLNGENQRILFDAGEGVQRLCVEHRVRLGKLEYVFLTSLSSATVMGLPGLFLTSSDSGRKEITFYGPVGILEFWQSTGSFTFRPQFKTNVIEISGYRCCDVGSVIIHCLSLSLEGPGTSSNVCYIAETKVLPGKFDVAKAKSLGVPVGPLFGALQRGNVVTLHDGTTVHPHDVLGPSEAPRYAAIICNVSSTSGDFASHAAMIERLVTHPFWDRFKIGGECSGLMECMFHYSPRSCTGVDSYISWMDSFRPVSSGGKRPPQHILLGKHNCLPQSAFLASAQYSGKLNRLFPDVFSYVSAFCADETSHACNSEEDSGTEAYPGLTFHLLPTRLIGFDTQTDIHIGQQLSEAIGACVDEMWLSVRDQVEDMQKAVYSDKRRIIDGATHICARATPDTTFPEASLCQSPTNAIIFLGTGCAQPSKYRNVSGIFVQLDGGGLLLDCGEGTWQQLVRMARRTPCMMEASPPPQLQPHRGIDEADVAELWAACVLKAVWISHSHADHHLGLIRVVTERKNILTSLSRSNQSGPVVPLLVIAPLSVLQFLKDFAVVDPAISDAYIPVCNNYFENKVCLSCVENGEVSQDGNLSRKTLASAPDVGLSANLSSTVYTRPKKRHRPSEFETLTTERENQIRDTFKELGVVQLENVIVEHCFQAYAVSIVLSTGCKLVYSGDTRPCRQLVELGRGATILIHEATFDDSKPDEALKKKHSTVTEAIQIAEDMGAFRLILTHFSQRYPSVPPLPENCRDVILAFDFMRITFLDCLWAHRMNQVLATVFPPDANEDDDEDDQLDRTDLATTATLSTVAKNKKQSVSRNNSERVENSVE